MKKSYLRESDIAHLSKLTEEILADVGSCGIILLRGNLASGKTSFVTAFAKSLGIDDAISSPTFSILHEYEKGLFHYDIYQCGSEGFLQNGLIEKLDEDGYHLIEWGDASFEAVLQKFGLRYSTIDIETIDIETIDIETIDIETIDLKRIYKVNIDAYA